MNALMPLDISDYQAMNCTFGEFQKITHSLPEKERYYVINVTHRLLEVSWIQNKLEEEVRQEHVLEQVGILNLQIYLLLTCADILGHILVEGTPKTRLETFFRELPTEAKSNLIDNILTWKTNFLEPVKKLSIAGEAS